jgi:hypothetical protein
MVPTARDAVLARKEGEMRRLVSNLLYGVGILVALVTLLILIFPVVPIRVVGLLLPAPVVFVVLAALLVVLGLTVEPRTARGGAPMRPGAPRAPRPMAIGDYVRARRIGGDGEWRIGVVVDIPSGGRLVLQGRRDRSVCHRRGARRIPESQWTEQDRTFVRIMREMLQEQ